MVNMFFFLKFRGQLRRTRPDLVERIEEAFVRAVEDAEGKLTGERPLFSAVFDENNLGFWLDMFILIENLKKNMDSSAELYGYALILCRDMPKSPELLCRFLAGRGGGVFLDGDASGSFFPYAVIDKPADWLKERGRRKYGAGYFHKIKNLKGFAPSMRNNADSQENVARILNQGIRRNTLILSPAFSLKSRGLYRYCRKLNGDFPTLTIRFGSGGIGALVDAWSGPVRALSNGTATEEIDRLWELLFRERIRDEVSAFYVRSARRFFYQLLDFYTNAAQMQNRIPVLVLENIHLTEKTETDTLLDLVTGMNRKPGSGLLILGTCADGVEVEWLRQWERVFARLIKTGNEKNEDFSFPELPVDLWEIVYAISLLGRYFSPGLFQRLFEEEEKNPVMIAKAFSILQVLGVIDNPREPQLLSDRFAEQAEHLLGEKTVRANVMVCRRLLSWVERRKINPCFRLLTIMAGLDCLNQIDERLILKCVLSDLINGTITGIDLAIKKGRLEEIVENERTAPVCFIFETARALLAGDEQEINRVFKEPPPDSESLPVLKAQILVNLCGYHLGRRDRGAAAETAKEAILLGQEKSSFCLPQAYRLFSLVSLSGQRTGETIDYLGFASANAETAGNYQETGITSYYAAAARFLYGDINKAMQFTRRSTEQSLAAGRSGWADRSRFLEGRLKFELGFYREAQELFEALQREPFDLMTDEKDRLLSAWIYRSKVYCQNPLAIKPELSSHDADLFEIEAAYLSGNFRKAVELSQSLSNPFSKDNFLYTERPDWRSGFAQCEYLFFSRGEIWDRMICVFRSLAHCRLSAAGAEEALNSMQRILRNERLSEMDPWDAFYFYAWYRVLEQTGAGLVDMNTAVSMAFKRLQRRASRIEDIETRRQYQQGPRWNRELNLAAKEFKLI